MGILSEMNLAGIMVSFNRKFAILRVPSLAHFRHPIYGSKCTPVILNLTFMVPSPKDFPVRWRGYP